jgi:hypothetical protein
MEVWVPRWESWLYAGPNSLLYEWTTSWSQFAAIPTDANHEHRLGIGVLAMVVIGVGYISSWRNRWVQVSALVACTLVAITTILPGGFTFWRYLFEVVPGAPAVRTLSRIVLIVLIPMGIGIALAIERIQHRWPTVLAAILALTIIAEQTILYPTYDVADGMDRSRPVVDRISEGCSSFLYSPDALDAGAVTSPTYAIQLDAMWAGILADTPTVNAYGHIVPPGWTFGEPIIATDADAARLAREIAAWEALHPDAAPVCHVVIPAAP